MLSGVRSIIFSVVATVATATAVAQTDMQFTQYWAVQNYYNPGAIGTTDNIQIKLGSRLQWVGIKKAPMSFNALADMPFKFVGNRFAVGVNISQQTMGLYKQLNATAQIGWRKKMLKGELGVGLQVGIINETFSGSEVYIPSGDDFHQTTDDAIPRQDIAGTGFDLAVGLHYRHKYFWVGVSATHINEANINLKTENADETNLYEVKAGRTMYFMAGGNIPVKGTLLEMQPSVFFKTDTKYFQGEATARVRYNKFISGGVAYRWKDAVSLLLGAEFKNVYLGYSFDYPVSSISKATHGSHEIWLGYNLKLNMQDKNKNKHKSIRIM